jgi:hypothetical protein
VKGIETDVNPRLLFSMGGALLMLTGVLALFVHPSTKPPKPKPPKPPVTTTVAKPAPTTTVAAPPTTTAPVLPPPARVAMSWSNAGAFVWHTHDVDPTWLGQQMKSAGFGWVAVYLGSTGNAYPIDPGWAARFVQASGLPVGGWSVLVGYPHSDAGFAATQLKKNGLTFYIANAEASYQSKKGASQSFVTAFRKLEPTMPSALSSFCNAQGIGLQPWASAGFDFLPQAYVNDFGASVSPAACVQASIGYFPRSSIHPTVGSYHGQKGWVHAQQYAQLLAQAGTTGFSVYLAETAMTADDWQTYGRAIAAQRIAVRVS